MAAKKRVLLALIGAQAQIIEELKQRSELNGESNRMGVSDLMSKIEALEEDANKSNLKLKWRAAIIEKHQELIASLSGENNSLKGAVEALEGELIGEKDKFRAEVERTRVQFRWRDTVIEKKQDIINGLINRKLKLEVRISELENWHKKK